MTDAEINEAVARALGWKTLFCESSCRCTQWFSPDGLGPISRDVWDWAQSLDACFLDLIPEARGYQLFLRCLWSSDSDNPDDNAVYWTARFADQYCQNLSATDLSPSRAICLAWLETKGTR